MDRTKDHLLPQIIIESTLRRSLKGDVLTFELRLFRVVVLKFLAALPREGCNKAPVYVRFNLDPNAGDKPGSVIIDG